MTRTPTPIDKSSLLAILAEIDGSKICTNRSSLFQKVADKYNGQHSQQISASLVYLRVSQWKVELSTPVGKKGRIKGFKIEGKSNKVSRSVKFANNSQIKSSLCQIRGIVPERFQPVVNRVVQGSMKAAVNLKCLDCCDYQTMEVKLCECQDCSLWPFRPYQKQKVKKNNT
jgi:hypothetical protein